MDFFERILRYAGLIGLCSHKNIGISGAYNVKCIVGQSLRNDPLLAHRQLRYRSARVNARELGPVWKRGEVGPRHEVRQLDREETREKGGRITDVRP